MKILAVNPSFSISGTEKKKNSKKQCTFCASINMGPSEAFYLVSKSIGSELLPYGYRNKPCLYVEKLVSSAKGSGTEAMKKIVKQSLAMPDYEGRISLLASGPGGEAITAIGFYYKLGFRAVKEDINKLCEEWIKRGGKREDCPKGKSYMYLPKENIEQCLNYPKK